jgi:hypothetical protein
LPMPSPFRSSSRLPQPVLSAIARPAGPVIPSCESSHENVSRSLFSPISSHLTVPGFVRTLSRNLPCYRRGHPRRLLPNPSYSDFIKDVHTKGTRQKTPNQGMGRPSPKFEWYVFGRHVQGPKSVNTSPVAKVRGLLCVLPSGALVEP